MSDEASEFRFPREVLLRLLSRAYIDGRDADKRERNGVKGAWEGGHYYAERIIAEIQDKDASKAP